MPRRPVEGLMISIAAVCLIGSPILAASPDAEAAAKILREFSVSDDELKLFCKLLSDEDVTLDASKEVFAEYEKKFGLDVVKAIAEANSVFATQPEASPDFEVLNDAVLTAFEKC